MLLLLSVARQLCHSPQIQMYKRVVLFHLQVVLLTFVGHGSDPKAHPESAAGTAWSNLPAKQSRLMREHHSALALSQLVKLWVQFQGLHPYH